MNATMDRSWVDFLVHTWTTKSLHWHMCRSMPMLSRPSIRFHYTCFLEKAIHRDTTAMQMPLTQLLCRLVYGTVHHDPPYDALIAVLISIMSCCMIQMQTIKMTQIPHAGKVQPGQKQTTPNPQLQTERWQSAKHVLSHYRI